MAAKPLTDREEQFAQTYLTNKSIVEAYAAAYDCDGLSPARINREAAIVANIPRIKKRIRELYNQEAEDNTETTARVLLKLWEIVDADVGELVKLKVGACRHCHGVDHGYQWRESEYLEMCDEVEAFNKTAAGLKQPRGYPNPAGGYGFEDAAPPVADCPLCSGEGVPRVVLTDTDNLTPAARAIYGGAKQTQNGIEVKIADKQRALETICRIHGLYDDKVRVSGLVTAIAKSVTLATTDPNEAERIYREMVAGKLTAPSSVH